MISVVKRNGNMEEYAREKLVTSMLKAGTNLNLAREIATRIENEVATRERVTTEEIRDKVLEELKIKDPTAYENWLLYDKAVKKR